MMRGPLNREPLKVPTKVASGARSARRGSSARRWRSGAPALCSLSFIVVELLLCFTVFLFNHRYVFYWLLFCLVFYWRASPGRREPFHAVYSFQTTLTPNPEKLYRFDPAIKQ